MATRNDKGASAPTQPDLDPIAAFLHEARRVHGPTASINRLIVFRLFYEGRYTVDEALWKNRSPQAVCKPLRQRGAGQRLPSYGDR